MAIYHLDKDILSNVGSLDAVEVTDKQFINTDQKVYQVLEKYCILNDGSMNLAWEYLSSFYMFSDNYGEMFSDNYLCKFSDQ